MQHIDLSSGTPDSARDQPATAASALLVGGAAEVAPLRLVLESASGGAFRVMVEEGVEPALARLHAERFDAVLLDLLHVGATAAESIARIREAAGGAALLIQRGDQGRLAPWGAGEDLVAAGETDRGTAACMRAAIERRRLRDELHSRSVQLAESEARFSNIVARTADGIVIVSMEGRVRFANAGAERMFARNATDLVDEDFGIGVVSGETTEMDIVRPSGRDPVIAELRVSGTTWEGLAAQIISLRDITHRKRAEEQAHHLQLEQSAREQAEKEAARSRILADAGATLDASLNAETTLARLSAVVVPRLADWCVIDLIEAGGTRRVAGTHSDPKKQELLEKLSQRFPAGIDSAGPGARVLQTGLALMHGALDELALRALSQNDEHAALLSLLGTRSTITVPLEAREQCLGAMTFASGERDYDDSDLALAGEIASRAARALDNSRLFEAAVDANRVKSDFLAVMSHELRTPLTAILGFTDLLLEGVAGEVEAAQQTYLGRIRAGASQLLTIIQEILTYAQGEAGLEQARPGAIIVGELVDEIAAAAEPLIREKGLEFRVEVERRDLLLHTDVGRIRHIILHLLTNAVKFTDKGSILLSVKRDENWIMIAVADTGIGISAGELGRIFEAFRQVEQGATRRAGGTGLGLSVSRQLAELLGGELNVESRLGEGTTLTLRLPASIATPSTDS